MLQSIQQIFGLDDKTYDFFYDLMGGHSDYFLNFATVFRDLGLVIFIFPFLLFLIDVRSVLSNRVKLKATLDDLRMIEKGKGVHPLPTQQGKQVFQSLGYRFFKRLLHLF